jgi:ElaB/YqjD/DUF883 family membrane-anchored ribosome-binding protein
MSTNVETAREVIKGRIEPVIESVHGSVDEAVRGARRAATRARHALEDSTAGAALRVRRHPLEAVATAAAVGVLVGGAVGLLLGWKTGGRPT